ncbi:quaternary ammonium compound efflux SMR transporter SugE [Halogeometricum borinquense]|uniref:Quaternary ammonium compound efflux SMR transporter SugE n=1 Tax=Halogeometricum borinquense TaxID=60847 RepID=A0A6C0UJ13_9EURY|nr:quaternary ammonium compound efflux SMR transporter SugE [Halogeometricum borinquense]QIB74291.1 quaternary ammonium compound efflux SMR transporter SugE [Halogeometricum borinquense]
MSWTYLLIAGVFEIGWAVGLEYTEGFTRPVPSILTGIAMIISMGLLAQAVKTLPVGTAYAVWTGIGAVGTAVAGIILFGEPRNVMRLLFISFIIAGVAGLKFTTGH